MSDAIKDATREAVTQGIQDVLQASGELTYTTGCITDLEHAITTRFLERIRDKVVLANEPSEVDLFRHCGQVDGDDWVKRVERLNGMIDGKREERGEVVK